jgi:hypothetical protein
MAALDQHVCRRYHAAIRRAHYGRVVADADDKVSVAGQPSPDCLDQSELAQIRDGDDCLPEPLPARDLRPARCAGERCLR